jgi:non-ribosomal peptide synthetase component E (peptide arylation enzyme)
MRSLLLRVLILATAAAALGACDHAKSAAAVAEDTSAAEHEAADARERALRIAERRETEVAGRGEADARELAHETAAQQQKIADTEAAGEHRIALARCEGLTGTPRRSCREVADARYEIAHGKALLARAEADPKL